MSAGAMTLGTPDSGAGGGGKTLRNMALPVAAISVLFVMVVPVPAFVMDMLLACSMAASILVFLSAVQLRRAVDFSVFPTLLLLLTLFRLSLNIASSRRILLHGNEGTAAAGRVIEAFGQFVVGGNYVVGFVLFLALIAIQFLVVSHGAVRTAEVTARFTLDALPGKQMAIDADMNAGLIDEATARKRRQAIAQEAEFYGAMDGAARFNQRDSLATILITAINIIAGLLIGTLQQGIDLGEAVRTYTILTVGDGLVTMIPSLLVSVAGGMVLTRASSAGQLTTELGAQLLGKGTHALRRERGAGSIVSDSGAAQAGVFAAGGGAGLCGDAGGEAGSAGDRGGDGGQGSREAGKSGGDAAAGRSESRNRIPAHPPGRREAGRPDAGAGEDAAAPPGAGAGLPDSPCAYFGQPAAEGAGVRGFAAGHRDRALADGRELPAGGVDRGPAAAAARAGDAGARLRRSGALDSSRPLEDEALAAGYSVVDQGTVIGTHLAELIRKHAQELLGRGETKRLLDSLNESHPKLVEELVPKILTLGEVERVLQQLLRERVSIRDLGTILEALVETAPQNRGLAQLVEAARQSLGRRLTQPLLEADGTLRVIALEPALEEELMALVSPERTARQLASGGNTPVSQTDLRFFENSHRSGACLGPARAALFQSGALPPEAMAGTGVSAADGAGAGGDPAGGAAFGRSPG